MMKANSAFALCAGLLSVSALAQDAPSERPAVALKYGAFDPATTVLSVPEILQGGEDTELWIVQFHRHATEVMRRAVREQGGAIYSYLPENAYVVRMPMAAALSVSGLGVVRSVSYYHPAFRLEKQLIAELMTSSATARRYNIVVVDKHADKPSLSARIALIGGEVLNQNSGSLLLEVFLDNAQLLQAARFDEVLWIDRWSAPEDDMDNARIQGGANYVEGIGGYTGRGITGHQMEGLNPNHVDWNNTPIGFPAGCTASDSHGHNTAGIVYGNGTSSPLARGMAPDAQAIFTSCRTNRYANFQSLIATHQILFTTASWGSARTRDYTSISAEADDICFDQDIIWTNSQSNAGNQDSRAEAWAKNVFAIGGVNHANNSNPLDDSWQNGSASIGPASDGRTKPELCAYYDNIATSASNGGFSLTFGGTSGATPIVAGHNALTLQMYTDGIFGNTLRNPGGSRFSNKPHFTTLKALQIVCANQYGFTAASTDNRREHQGYGFPSLRNMYDDRGVLYIVDEEDVIAQGQGMRYTLAVPAGRPELKISMSYSDPAANPSSTLARINDLTLRVISPSGTRYWGNYGLTSGTSSLTGGSRDEINTLENVFVRNPEAGNWKVDVIGYIIATDAHVETPAVDADFGLVARGATFVSKAPITIAVGSISKFGTGCVGSGQQPNFCLSQNTTGALTRETRAWEYASRVFTPTALSVAGFELRTASVSGGTVIQNAALYLGTAAGPTDPAIASATMTIGGAEGFYSTTFPAPVNVPANSYFYLALTHADSSYVSTVVSGTTSPGYYRLATGTWTSSGLLTEPAYRVLCAGGGSNAVPLFQLSGTPDIGESLDAELSLAAANVAASLLVGFSNTTLGSVPLPFDMGPIGAAGCRLYTSTDFAIATVTNSSGSALVSIPIPPDGTLVGFGVYMQFFVIDPPANSLGAAVTDAAAVLFGG